MGEAELRVGLLLPTREMAITGNNDAEYLLGFARQAEAGGVDALWAGDSLTARPRWDPLMVLASVASVTHRVGLGTAALTAVLRNPLVGATMISSLDHLCGGRLSLALGAGFPVPESETEFDNVGVPFRGRAGRLDELIGLWKAAWSANPAEALAGRPEKSRFPDAGFTDLHPPARTGGPPLWLASSDTDRVIARVARHYDGWLPFLPDPDAYARAWDRIRERTVVSGRGPDAVTPGLYATININADIPRATEELDAYCQRYYGRPLDVMRQVQAYHAGGPAECADWLGRYFRAGARAFVVRIGSLTPETQVKEFTEALLPALRAMG